MRKYAGLLLRAALAFSFLYPPIAAWSDPFTWLGYIPHFVTAFWPFSNLLLLHTFGIVEIILALWILSGRKIYIPCALAAFILLFIVVTNTDQFDVLFRDLSIAALAVSLAIRNWPKKESTAIS
jgi:uncharacterized membrane protein YphA (DoxX/SURF4 family)